jgi:hypothetical protein
MNAPALRTMAAHLGKSSALGTGEYHFFLIPFLPDSRSDLAAVLLKIPFPPRVALRLRSINNFLPPSDGSCLALRLSTSRSTVPASFACAVGFGTTALAYISDRTLLL